MSIREWAQRNGWSVSVRGWMMDIMSVTFSQGDASFSVCLKLGILERKRQSRVVLDALEQRAADAMLAGVAA